MFPPVMFLSDCINSLARLLLALIAAAERLMCFGMVMIIIMMMADRRQIHEDRGQQGEYQALV